jgi:hypothetical protein
MLMHALSSAAPLCRQHQMRGHSSSIRDVQHNCACAYPSDAWTVLGNVATAQHARVSSSLSLSLSTAVCLTLVSCIVRAQV